MRGLRKGAEAARLWATRAPGGVQQTIELEQLYEGGTEAGAACRCADRAGLALGRGRVAPARTRWPGSFELRDHRIRSWRPFEDRAEALRAGSFGAQ